MVEYFDGTVFNAATQAIVNTVNCHGVMGAGLALEFRLRYPAMARDYVERFHAGHLHPGEPYLYTEASGEWIINFPTKNHWRFPSKIEWIRHGLERLREICLEHHIASVAVPPLGCGLGGLAWHEVQSLIEATLGDAPFKTIVCLDRALEPAGLELAMVNLLNDCTVEELEHAGLTKNAISKILNRRPFRRFYELLAGKVVSSMLYERLYLYFLRIIAAGDGKYLPQSKAEG